MTRYIFSMEHVGQAFHFEVTLFCQSVGQKGKETEVYHEAMSQMFAIFGESHQDFLHSTLRIPQWTNILYVAADPIGPVFDRFRDAVRSTAVQLRTMIQNHPLVEPPTPGCLYLMESVTINTAIFSICQDAIYH